MTLAHRGSRTALSLVLALGALQLGCSSDGGAGKTPELIEGQTDFVSAPPNGAQSRNGGNLNEGDAASGAGGTTSATPAAPGGSKGGSTSTPRTVEETDLYRL